MCRITASLTFGKFLSAVTTLTDDQWLGFTVVPQ